MSLPADYFDRLYAASADPWGFRDRWYEQRKRDLTLAALPRARYASAYEPGCSLGLLTERLASRCDRLLATDVSGAVLAQARHRLAESPHVQLEQASLQEWDGAAVELVVLSEVGYYLDAASLAAVGRRIAAALLPGGALLLCHWRHPVADYPLGGDEVHAVLRSATGLVPTVRHEERDVLIEVLTTTGDSVAHETGLL